MSQNGFVTKKKKKMKQGRQRDFKLSDRAFTVTVLFRLKT